MRSALLLQAAVSAAMALHGDMQAATPEPAPKVCSEYFKSELVFTGTVVSVNELAPEGDSEGGWEYRLDVLTVFRGPDQQTVEVSTENTSARFPLKIGASYLLFASRQQGRLWVYDGGNSHVIERSSKQLQELEKLRRPGPGGWVEGRVVSRSKDGWAPVPAASLLVSSENGETRSARADARGSFHVLLASGSYRIVASSPNWLIKPFDLSYDDPDKISIQNGQCAQVLFVAERPK
jgi:hypothetical protein